MFPFRRLLVWKKAHALALSLLNDLREVRGFPARIVAEQAWRAACSIGANVSEGSGYPSQAQFARHLAIAIGSAHELENHLLILRDASLIPPERADFRLNALGEVRAMLFALHRKVRADASTHRRSE